MDDFHHRENWPFVIERKPVPTHDPVSPAESEKGDSERAGSSRTEVYENDDEAPVSDEDEDVSNSPTEVSPIQSSRSSLEKTDVLTDGVEAPQLHRDIQPLRPPVDDLYENEDEERDIITPIPSAGLIAGAEAPNPFESETVNGHKTPTPTSQSRSSSIVKRAQSSRSVPRRTPSITAQTPLSRQRVRYSWQSGQDEEPNRPRINVVKLVSNTATASAGFPQGEAFGFSISPCGRRIAAFNSARLYILQSQALPVGISQEYALKRRPLAVEVVDEGNAIAILADEYTVNVYDLEHQLLRRIKTIKLDNATSCIALSPTGGLLAVAYEGGVEVFSLAPDALATDRRAVRSQKVDRLMFSKDASTLVGTTTRINVSSTVVISVPVFPSSASGTPTHGELKEAWCSELLQPENIRNSSHATFMWENLESRNDRLFAWNGLQETFGVLRIPDMMYTNLDFPVVISPPLSTLGGLGAAIHCCPDVDEHGDAVAMIVNDRTIRLYLVPNQPDDDETIVEAHSIDHELDEGYGCPFTDVRWVQTGNPLLPSLQNGPKQVHGRLIVTSPGAVIERDLTEEVLDVEDLEGGRIIMFDFDPQHIGLPGQTFSLTLGNSPPQVLEEPDFDVAHEVAIIRRRTVNQNKSSTLSQKPITLGRSATSSGNRTKRSSKAITPIITPSNATRRVQPSQVEAEKALPDLAESTEASEPLDEPYAQNAPRSQASLQRAATNAQRHRFQALEEKDQENISVDSTGNFLALPEYSEEPNAPLPSRFRAMAGLDGPTPPPATKPSIVTNSGNNVPAASGGLSSVPPRLAQHYQAQEAFATASYAPHPHQGVPEHGSTPTGAGPPVAVAAASPTGMTDSIPPALGLDTTRVAGPTSPRFLQRAYANGPGISPTAGAPPPRLIGDWENVSPVVPSHISRPPLGGSPVSVSTERLNVGVSGGRSDGQWDVAVSPLLPTSPATPPFSRPPPSGPQYRFSTSQLNPPGHASTTYSPFPRAPSSSGSFAPSMQSSVAPSLRDSRIPPHMQAFRAAAAASNSESASPLYSHNSYRPASSGPNSSLNATWRPSAQSTTAHTAMPRSHSISTRSERASTIRSKSLLRRGTRKKSSLLFGAQFASQQPGARPSTADSEGGTKSMFETKSIFTVKTKRGETRCSVM